MLLISLTLFRSCKRNPPRVFFIVFNTAVNLDVLQKNAPLYLFQWAEIQNMTTNTDMQNLLILVVFNCLGNPLEWYLVLLLSIELKCMSSASNNVRLNLSKWSFCLGICLQKLWFQIIVFRSDKFYFRYSPLYHLRHLNFLI